MNNKTYICSFCSKICKNSNSFAQHQIRCPKNPNRINCYNKGFNTKGKIPWNKGLTKETSPSIAKQADKKRKIRPLWQIDIDDDGKLYQKYLNKKSNARIAGLICELTFEEYCMLVKEANLVSSQLGFTGDNYVLARYNDCGNYKYGNCRFILQSENVKERKISEKSSKASRENLKQFNDKVKADPKLKAYIHERQISSPYYTALREKTLEKQKLLDANKDKRYCKEHNSQYGTYWITNGVNNMKWKDSKGPIPNTYYKGRICK